MPMTTVPAPFHISPRLMAAYKILGVGTLHLGVVGRDDEQRVQYRYVIEDTDGRDLYTNDDLRSGARANVDFLGLMASLLAFLGAAAEEYARDMTPVLEDPSFPPHVQEWAYLHADELDLARYELEEADED